MVFTKREQYLGIGVGATVALLLLYYYLITPYFERREQIRIDLRAATDQRDQADVLFRRQRQKQRVWAAMTAGGLKSSISEADSQALHALNEWAKESGLTVGSLKRERETQEGNFVQISFHAAGSGGMGAIARFLWRLETASIPLRVNELQVTPRKEGTDDLQLQLSVSTLCLPPEADKSDKDRRTLTSAAEFRGDH